MQNNVLARVSSGHCCSSVIDYTAKCVEPEGLKVVDEMYCPMLSTIVSFGGMVAEAPNKEASIQARAAASFW